MFKELTERFAILNEDKPSKKRVDANIAAVRSRIEKEEVMNNKEKFKPRRYLAGIIAAAAAIVCLTVTASATGIIDPLGAFKSFFLKRAATVGGISESETAENLSASLDFSAAGITEYSKTIDLKEYTVTVKGFMSDLHCIYVYYDITYKDETFFGNSKLKDYFIKETPINILSKDLNVHTISCGDGIGIDEDGKTVSYVGRFDGDFSGNVNAVTGNCEFKMTITCFSGDPFTLENYLAGPFEMEVSVPTTEKERYAECSLALELPSGKTTTLEGVLISPLSASLYFDNDYFFGSEAARFVRYDKFSFIMKNGEKVDFNGDSAVFYHNPTPEMLADALEKGEKGSYPLLVSPDGSFAVTEPNDTGIPVIYKTSFAAVIDPDEVAGIEIMGNKVMFG